MSTHVSAVIPCKDRFELLDRALTSICRQTVRPDEIIVVDDGSQPHLSLTQQYAMPVSVIRQENQGPAVARNRGIAEASGEWIALLDSDDTWIPEKMECQLRLISEYPRAGFCVSNMVTHGRPAAEFPLAPASGRTEGIVEDALERLLPGRFISTSGVMFRKDLFMQVGMFDESLWFCEDSDLWVRLASITPVVVTTQYLSDVFREGNNLSDFEDNPASGEVIASIFRKVMASPLFNVEIREEAGRILGQKLYDLAYTYRKHGMPLSSCWATLRSLANHGPVKANIKNLILCWPEAILVGAHVGAPSPSTSGRWRTTPGT